MRRGTRPQRNGIMKWAIACTLLMAMSLLTACASDHQSPPMAGLAEPDSTIRAEYAAFYGVWSGKWDEHWDVILVIDEIDDDGSIGGDYYWKERIPGPWSYRRLAGYIEGGSAQLDFIRIDLDSAATDTATAIGDFPTDRTARLTKLKPSSESATFVW